MSDRIELIRARAYEIWREAGEPEGLADEHWRQAEREIGGDDLEAEPESGQSGSPLGAINDDAGA